MGTDGLPWKDTGMDHWTASTWVGKIVFSLFCFINGLNHFTRMKHGKHLGLAAAALLLAALVHRGGAI